MSKCDSGALRSADELAACTTSGRMPAARSRSRACANRASCSADTASSGLSAHARCVYAPATVRCGQAATARAASAASSARTPSRFIPVSIFRWTARVTRFAAARRSSGSAVAGPSTVGVRPYSMAAAASSSGVRPITRMGVRMPWTRSATPSSTMATPSMSMPAPAMARPASTAPWP